jgi:replicative DNA helicase
MALQPDYLAEKLILTAILNERAVSSMLFATLTPDDFVVPLHSLVFKTAKENHDNNGSFDPVGIYQKLQGKCDYKYAEIANIQDGVPDLGEDVAAYTIQLHRNRRRINLVRLYDYLGDVIHANDGNPNIDHVYQQAEQKLHQGIEIQNRQGKSTQQIINEHIQHLIETKKNPDRNYVRVSDWYKLKQAIPFERGCLYGIAARPGGGKSAAMIHMLTRFATQGYKGIFFSIEMNRAQVCNRIFSNMTGTEKFKFRYGLQDEETLRSIPKRIPDVIKNVHLVLCEKLTPTMIASAMYEAKHFFNGLDYILVDYLQIVDAGDVKFKKRYEEIGTNCQEIRRLAKLLDVAGVMGIQVGRQVEESQKVRNIRLSDFRESGDIENHLDGAIAMNVTDRGVAIDLLNMDIIKNREGELMSVSMEHKKDFNIIMECSEDD